MTDARLASLAALAELRALRTARRLRPCLTEVDALKARIDTLRVPSAQPPADLAEAALHDRHARWRHDQIVLATEALARAEAAAQPLREALARDRARETILRRLAGPVARRQFD